MENTNFSPTVVNYRWDNRHQLTTAAICIKRTQKLQFLVTVRHAKHFQFLTKIIESFICTKIIQFASSKSQVSYILHIYKQCSLFRVLFYIILSKMLVSHYVRKLKIKHGLDVLLYCCCWNC